ncbi:MAG TPA: hopanoid biosynthesis-associated protein HpnK [Caulobacteraceae bacterium]|nr:hopanoid biosynthesis-associated protein HpnK [Caulobacteraceae bacterium]
MPDRLLIVTADDFGLSLEVNEAVEAAHRRGILTCASLVVAGAAAEDAIRRAKAMPDLGVGLHLALVDAPPALPPGEIPDLVDERGALTLNPAGVGTKIAFSRRARDEARAEVRAQFEAFRRSGLALDHVDGHWHFHQHPAITDLIVELAPEYGVKAVRTPNEPALASWRAAGRRGLAARTATALGHAPLWARLRRRLTAAGIATNDWFFGLNDGGAMDAGQLARTIANLPPGASEIGLHPAAAPPPAPHAPPAAWRLVDEMNGLMAPEVREAARAVRLGRFCDLPAWRRAA